MIAVFFGKSRGLIGMAQHPHTTEYLKMFRKSTISRNTQARVTVRARMLESHDPGWTKRGRIFYNVSTIDRE